MEKLDKQIIIFDVNTKDKELAKKILLKICCNEAFTPLKVGNHFKLIFTNTKITENCLHGKDGQEGYQHINEITNQSDEWTKENLLNIGEKLKNAEPAEAKWFEALEVAIANIKDGIEKMKEIKKRKNKKKIKKIEIVTYQILFISDFNVACTIPDNTIDRLIEDLYSIKAYLYIIGPNVEIPFRITSNMNIKHFMDSVTVDENNLTLQAVKSIIQKYDKAMVCNYKLGIHLFKCFKNFPGGQPWTVPLCMGEIKFNAQTFRILEFKHNRTVPKPNKMEGTTRCFEIIQFVQKSQIPEWSMGGWGSYYTISNDSSGALETLIECLIAQDKYIIAKRTYRAGFKPNIVVLIPREEGLQKYLILSTLQNEDKIKSLIPPANQDVRDNSVYEFLDSIDVDKCENDHHFPLSIDMVQNPLT